MRIKSDDLFNWTMFAIGLSVTVYRCYKAYKAADLKREAYEWVSDMRLKLAKLEDYATEKYFTLEQFIMAMRKAQGIIRYEAAEVYTKNPYIQQQSRVLLEEIDLLIKHSR